MAASCIINRMLRTVVRAEVFILKVKAKPVLALNDGNHTFRCFEVTDHTHIAT